jgi:predicted small lipoprotein YifL
MKRLISLAAVACLALAGCQSVGPIASPPAASQVAIADAGTGIDATYNAAAQVYLGAETALPPATKAQVKSLLVQAYAYVQAADAAAKLGDAPTLAAQIDAATSLLSQATALLPAKAQ